MLSWLERTPIVTPLSLLRAMGTPTQYAR